jgi:hypothetical protein
VIRALPGDEVEGMNRDAWLVARLWDHTEACRITSPYGHDVSFQIAPLRRIVDDGALTEDGGIDFVAGTRLSLPRMRDTINGRTVVDAGDSVRGLGRRPDLPAIENGMITFIEGGMGAKVTREWIRPGAARGWTWLCEPQRAAHAGRNEQPSSHQLEYSIDWSALPLQLRQPGPEADLALQAQPVPLAADADHGRGIRQAVQNRGF